jgi:hypothetical protein
MRLLAGALLVLSLSASAQAAGFVDLNVDVYHQDPGRLTIRSSLAAPALGGIGLLVDGAAGFAFEPVPGLSLLDSSYIDSIFGGSTDAILFVGAPGAAILSPGQQLVLGHFVSPSSSQFGLLAGDEVFGATLFDTSFQPLQTVFLVSVVCDGACFGEQDYRIIVPESEGLGAVALLALALGAHVLGGKIRRRSGSVAAPT